MTYHPPSTINVRLIDLNMSAGNLVAGIPKWLISR